jgi:hypothetical protein
MKSLSTVLILLVLSSCSNFNARTPSSSIKELSISTDYRGYQFVASDDLRDHGEEKVLKKDLAQSLCEKIGADLGAFVGTEIVDFGHRGPDWAAQYDEKEKKFILVEKQKFVAPEQLVCSFSKEVSCTPDYSNYSLMDIQSGDLKCN